MSLSKSNLMFMMPWICFHSLTLVPSHCFVVPGWIPRPTRSSRMAAESDERDLFDYFDPLLSPHAYPDGVSPDHKPEEHKKITNEDRETPTRMYQRSTEAADIDPAEVFDPTLSPHAYPHGTPSTLVGDRVVSKRVSRRVGILLMDHGSRNEESNKRLQDLARVYQENVESSHVIVRAAHMEIASPSIPEGLESLLKEGVDEIVCHPYFLSPHGRHVAEDVPEIINGAIDSLNIEIPVITTEPVGANMNLMVGIIRSMVEESSQVLRKNA